MARNESDREDLLREATALVERIEFQLNDSATGEPIVAGFRADGAMSIFFGADSVYQFNAAGELRRGFCNGQIYKAVRGRLASLRRDRDANEVQLLRHDLSDAEQDSFLLELIARLRKLGDQLDANQFTVTGQVPMDSNVLGRLKLWLSNKQEIKIANRPNA